MLLTPGSIIAGKFRLERPLAEGGMGALWVAFNQQLEVPVALKFMATALVESPDLVARFEREAKAAAQLRHPNVVQIFEYGVDRGMPFIAMELLEGESLGMRLRARRRLPLAEVSRILGSACLALRRAHEKGLVHRDLKPANIFLAWHDELETVKVLDFGIAKSLAPAANEEVTKTGAVFGSPHYMAPEQARRTNKLVDHRSDLWALGVITFRCLTGQLPFPGDDTIDVLIRVCTETPPTPSSIAPDLGPEVDAFFACALAREPDARFQSARDFAEALATLSGGARERDSLAFIGSARSLAGGDLPPRPADPGSGGDASDRDETIPIQSASASVLGWAPLPDRTEPTLPGTLTSAGTEVGAPASPARGRSRMVVAGAMAAALIGIGVVVSTVVSSGGGPTPGDRTTGAPASGAAAASSEVAPAPSGGEPPSAAVATAGEIAPATATANTTASALATASAATAAFDEEPSLSPTAAPAASVAAAASPDPSPTSSPTAASPRPPQPSSSARPTATTTGKTSLPAAPQPGSGYLGKPKF